MYIIIIIIKFVFSPWDFYSLGPKNNNNYYYYYYSYFLLPRAKIFFYNNNNIIIIIFIILSSRKAPTLWWGLKMRFFRCLNINISENFFWWAPSHDLPMSRAQDDMGTLWSKQMSGCITRASFRRVHVTHFIAQNFALVSSHIRKSSTQ